MVYRGKERHERGGTVRSSLCYLKLMLEMPEDRTMSARWFSMRVRHRLRVRWCTFGWKLDDMVPIMLRQTALHASRSQRHTDTR